MSEYFRYSKFGKLVIIDIGGLIRGSNAGGTITNSVPILRTRPVLIAGTDSAGTSLYMGCIYGDIGNTSINTHIGINNPRVFGQMVYFTD